MTRKGFNRDPSGGLLAPLANPFVFVRHGQTDWNARGLYQGQKDIPLNPAGRAQAALCGEALRAMVTITTICTSPLARARETSDIIARHNPAKIVEIEDLAECGFGDLEGQPKSDPDFDLRWRAGAAPHKVEPYAAFSDRVLRGIASALNEEAPVLVVAHRAVFWPLSNALCGTVAKDLPNCQPVTFLPPASPGARWRIQTFRDNAPMSKGGPA